MSIESVMPSNHLILYRPLLPSTFPRIRIFSSESAHRLRVGPKLMTGVRRRRECMHREAEMGVRQPQDKDHQGGRWPPESKHRKCTVHSPSRPAITLTSDFCLQSCEKTHFCCLKPAPPPAFSNSLQHPQETPCRGSIAIW